MAVVDLTEAVVAAACLASRATASGRPVKDAIYRDKTLTGFCVRVTAAGKTFLAEYPAPGGGHRRVSLGRWGTVTVAQARRQARVLLGEAAAGRDPFAERQAAARQAVRDAYTLGRLVEDWREGRQGIRREGYLSEAASCLRRHLNGHWDKPAGSLSVADAVELLDRVRVKAGDTTANRCLAYARAAYGWALRRQAVAANPFAGLSAPGAETARERVLSLDECKAIWKATSALGPIPGAVVRLLLLTLQRRSEVAGMKWSEVDLPGRIWVVPSDRVKDGRATAVHLSEPAAAVLLSLPRINSVPFVFPGRGHQPFSNFSNTKAALVGKLPAGMAQWQWHDFRRSGVTWLAGQGVAPHVADRLLNHITGSISGVAAIYQRHDFASDRLAALDMWGGAVTP